MAMGPQFASQHIREQVSAVKTDPRDSMDSVQSGYISKNVRICIAEATLKHNFGRQWKSTLAAARVTLNLGRSKLDMISSAPVAPVAVAAFAGTQSGLGPWRALSRDSRDSRDLRRLARDPLNTALCSVRRQVHNQDSTRSCNLSSCIVDLCL